MFRRAIRGVGRTLFPGWWKQFGDYRVARRERRQWDQRIADVLASPDNARLRRVANAGEIVGGYQIMHNGLKVLVNGYYGDGITRMLSVNRGSHEPQEEVVFDAIVHCLPAASTMVELGAYWGFYSMWFCQAVERARVFLVEPAAENLRVGETNFRENGYTGDFTHAYVGAAPGRSEDGTAIISVESFLAEKGLERVQLLHADIQGFEGQMLQGMRSVLTERRIDYLFISTHSMELHRECAGSLREHGYKILASVSLEESHSVDGVLIACAPAIDPPELIPPARKSDAS